MKIPWKNMASRITGFTTPFGGVTWDARKPDSNLVASQVSDFITFLEGRSALFAPYYYEMPVYVVSSILEIRDQLTSKLQQIGRDNEASRYLRAMRLSCLKFLQQTGPLMERLEHYPYHEDHMRLFFQELGALRTAFGIPLALLSIKYQIDLDETLATILPDIDDSQDDFDQEAR